MSYIITVPATVEPITLEEAKMHLRVDADYEDTLIAFYLQAARAHCERFTGISFTVQTVKATFLTTKQDQTIYRWPDIPFTVDAFFELPLSPVAEILSVTDGTDPVEYTSDLDSIPARVFMDERKDKVVITYRTNAGVVTPDAKIAILMVLHQMYETRGNVEDMSLERVEEAYLRHMRVNKGMA